MSLLEVGNLSIDFGPRWSPLLATVCLFFLPSVFMGTVSPYAIKLAASSLATIGNTAGLIYAISTAGSIVRSPKPKRVSESASIVWAE